MTTTPLTNMDASFLFAESARTPLHVGSLSIFEGGPFHDAAGRFRLDEVRDLVEERLHLVPRLRQRLVVPPLGLGGPRWADDPDFEISNHVDLAAAPAPVSDIELRDLCARLHMEPLDRSRPLWELWFVDGLEGNRVAMVEKIHHAMVDGVSGVDVATTLFDASPEVRRFGYVPWRPPELPTAWELAATELTERSLRWAGRTRRRIERLRMAGATVRAAGQLTGPVASLVTLGGLAPRSSLNRSIGSRRRYEVTRLSLAEVKEVKSLLGGTVNDVALAIVTGGLRQLLMARGEAVDVAPLHALVPVSVRAPGAGSALGNQVAAIIAPLPVAEAEPLARYAAVRAAMSERKARGQAEASAALVTVSNGLPPRVAAGVARLVHRQPFVNVVVTNVPGPQEPLFAMGARMLETFPIVPLAGNLDVSIGILSYAGALTFGLFADDDTCADVGVLAEGIEKSFVELRHAAEEAQR